MSPNIASFCMNSEIKIKYNLDVDGSAHSVRFYKVNRVNSLNFHKSYLKIDLKHSAADASSGRCPYSKCSLSFCQADSFSK